MHADALIDANVILRHVLHDNPDQAQRATAHIANVERGVRVVRLTDTVIFETVYTLQRFYGVPRQEIRDHIEPIINLPGMILPGKQVYADVFDLWVLETGLSFADCYHLCLARQLGLPAILTFDRKLNRLPGVVREEP